MSNSYRRTTAIVFAFAVLCAAPAAEAQVVRIGRGAGIVVRAPYAPPVAVNLGLGGVVPRVPLPRPYLLPRRRVLAGDPRAAAAAGGAAGAAPLTEAPRYTPGATRASVDGANQQRPGAPDRPFPTAAELAALDDGTLLNALLDVSSRLDFDLGQFDTGAGWQRYLRFPEDALPPPTADGRVTLGFKSLTTTLDRLNSVAANSAYPMISRLPSFVATQAALQEVVGRFGQRDGVPNKGAPAAGLSRGANSEELPTPPPSLTAPANASGERSILAR